MGLQSWIYVITLIHHLTAQKCSKKNDVEMHKTTKHTSQVTQGSSKHAQNKILKKLTNPYAKRDTI